MFHDAERGNNRNSGFAGEIRGLLPEMGENSSRIVKNERVRGTRSLQSGQSRVAVGRRVLLLRAGVDFLQKIETSEW